MKSIVREFSTLLGVTLAFFFIIVSIHLGGGTIKSFFDLPAALIVIGGTYALTAACFSIPELLNAQKVIGKTIFYHGEDLSVAARKALELAEAARKKGLLGLQNQTGLLKHNSFLERGVYMIVDGTPHEEVERIMLQEIGAMVDRHLRSSSILRKSAELSPAMGLIATLIGLIQMLGSLSDPSTIGAAMAVALLGTFYGATLSYMLFQPLATKLERNSKQEVLIMRMYTKTAVSIGKKENPRRLEILLNSILPPAKRVKYFL